MNIESARRGRGNLYAGRGAGSPTAGDELVTDNCCCSATIRLGKLKVMNQTLFHRTGNELSRGGWIVALATLILWLLPPSLSADDLVPASERLARFKQRWNLELLPDKLPPYFLYPEQQLPGKTWRGGGPRTVTGRGIEWFFTISPATDPPADHEIAIRTVRHPGVESKVGPEETRDAYPLTLAGPFLEYDDQIHTYYMHEDKRQTVPDVLLRVGPRQWYRVTSWKESQAADPAKSGEIHVAEYLIEFQDDPLRQNSGQVTIHGRSGLRVEASRKTRTLVTKYTSSFQNSPPTYHEVQFPLPNQTDFGGGFGGPTLRAIFFGDQNYALDGSRGPGLRSADPRGLKLVENQQK
ncbi:MAG: hypothetical protein JSS02_08965 [Planctomycetes bacterium]|nr:hypothetical protein [Planctomycetota bacterium]